MVPGQLASGIAATLFCSGATDVSDGRRLVLADCFRLQLNADSQELKMMVRRWREFSWCCDLAAPTEVPRNPPVTIDQTMGWMVERPISAAPS